MATFAGGYTLAGLVLLGFALLPRSVVRNWLTSRRHPLVAGGTLLAGWLVGLLLLVASGALPPHWPSTQPVSTEQPASTSTSERVHEPEPTTVPDGAQRASVERIVDGDTLELSAATDEGALPANTSVDVRLLEIDTPETKHPREPVQCYGPQATVELERLVPRDSTVWVQRDRELRDRYGRYLLYLWTEQGEFVNLHMVERGYARAALYQPNDKHWDVIKTAEREARSTGTALWGACPSFGAPRDGS